MKKVKNSEKSDKKTTLKEADIGSSKKTVDLAETNAAKDDSNMSAMIQGELNDSKDRDVDPQAQNGKLKATLESESELESEFEVSSNTAVGHAHSDISKAKISAANKGKVPWNVGKKHSEETKARIAEKTKEAMLKRRVTKALAEGFSSLEAYEEKKKEDKLAIKLEKDKSKVKGLTEAGRKRISDRYVCSYGHMFEIITYDKDRQPSTTVRNVKNHFYDALLITIRIYCEESCCEYCQLSFRKF